LTGEAMQGGLFMLKPFKELVAMSKEKLDEAMAPIRACVGVRLGFTDCLIVGAGGLGVAAARRLDRRAPRTLPDASSR
jgi:hypothetical protein